MKTYHVFNVQSGAVYHMKLCKESEESVNIF